MDMKYSKIVDKQTFFIINRFLSKREKAVIIYINKAWSPLVIRASSEVDLAIG